MATRGVPQDEVFQAADALLAAGERPTADKVRVAIGRGSPNAISPVLDRWWTQLAERMARQLALPGVPDAVASAFAQAWAAALAAGQVHAEAMVAPERAALADVLSKAEGRIADERALRAQLETQLATARGDATASHAALAISEQRNSDLQRQIASQQAELQALSVRLDATLARHHLVVQQAEEARTAAAAERDTLQAHQRQVEDRAYGEVDRIRQELKGLKAQLASQAREHALALRDKDKFRRDAEAVASRAQREVAVLQGRLTALAASSSSRKPAPAKRALKTASGSPRRAAGTGTG